MQAKDPRESPPWKAGTYSKVRVITGNFEINPHLLLIYYGITRSLEVLERDVPFLKEFAAEQRICKGKTVKTTLSEFAERKYPQPATRSLAQCERKGIKKHKATWKPT